MWKTKLSCETPLKIWKLKMWKRSFRARPPSKSASWRCGHEAFARDFPQNLNIRHFFAVKLLCYEISLLWNLIAVKVPCYEFSLLWDLFSVKPLCCEMLLLWDLSAVRLLCCEISLLRNFFAVRSLCCETSLLWNLFAVRLWHPFAVTSHRHPIAWTSLGYDLKICCTEV